MTEVQIENIKKKIKLEEELQKINKKELNSLEFLSYIRKKYTNEECAYLKNAYIMPISEIEMYLDIYDSGRPKLDELKFISDLEEHYHVPQKAIIHRIQEVRKIRKVKKDIKEMELNVKKVKKRRK